METISVWKLNHSDLQVQCESSTAYELNEFFSFYVPGYKFMPAYRNKVWDGKIRLFNVRNQVLPVGLYYHLLEFAKERGYTLDPQKTTYGTPAEIDNIDSVELMKFVKALNLPFDIRDYQFDGIAHGLSKKRSILVSPTGSGKSLIIYTLVCYFLSRVSEGQKVLLVVPTTSLVEQMYNDFKDYGMPVDSECHRIYSGKDKVTNKKIIISTWQSIYKLPSDWFEQFGMVIGDECHGFKSKSLTSIMNKCTEAEYRFGTTGTLDGTQTHELVLQGLFGKTHRVTTTKDLQDNDTLAKLNITRIVLEYTDEVRKDFNKSYQDEIDFIVKYENRNKFIRNLALDITGNTLVLFQFVEKHGKILHKLIEDKAHEHRRIFFVSGATATSDREAVRKIVEKQKDAIIVASLGTFSTGINIKNIHNIIFASPSKSQIRVLQSIGRGLRKSDNGKDTTLYDICDDISYKTRKNFALIHSYERLRIYQNEKFNYKTHKVSI